MQLAEGMHGLQRLLISLTAQTVLQKTLKPSPPASVAVF
jgi:hypothetical protein